MTWRKKTPRQFSKRIQWQAEYVVQQNGRPGKMRLCPNMGRGVQRTRVNRSKEKEITMVKHFGKSKKY